MRGIAELLFGRDVGRALDLVLGPTGEERDMAARVGDAGRWCGTTPGAAAPAWHAGTRRAAGRHQVIIRSSRWPR